MMDFADMLEHISDTLDPDEILDRLGLSSREVCDLLADQIESKLIEFQDCFEASEE